MRVFFRKNKNKKSCSMFKILKYSKLKHGMLSYCIAFFLLFYVITSNILLFWFYHSLVGRYYDFSSLIITVPLILLYTLIEF
jgi:hypothetical protein